MIALPSQGFTLGAGGIGGVGPGIAGYTAWIVAAAIMLLLAALAWWTMRPARRATRAELRSSRRRRTTEPSPVPPDRPRGR